MKNLNNTVILSNGGEHGKRVIEWWKKQGVDIKNQNGQNKGYYYGLINGHFSNFYPVPNFVKIIELPNDNIIGRKVRGFKFEEANGFKYYNDMDKYIGEIGIISEHDMKFCTVKFKDDHWWYPTSLIHEHLVEEDINVDTSPQIIDLSNVEGVEMMVSREMMLNVSNKHWVKAKVVAKIGNVYVDNEGYVWFYAKPIEVKKVTMQQLQKIVGYEFEIIE